ncbi:MAG TPA: hypothetical protein VHZ25_08615 [Acidobacteriaceae bacterium]|nr:hypothetical protein [Acidobacteriaceae bacterium]
MKPEPLIQKLFAIERAIGHTTPAALRAMVIEAQETALRMDLENLHDIDTLRRRLESHEAGLLRRTIPIDDSASYRSA